ncbi:MAG TPA: CDP-alcohol phosphatidyltransferase family protein [Prolixibacteraceae bacterium]
MKNIPFLLVYSRIVIALVIGVITWSGFPNTPILVVAFMTIGLITDVLDGVIARLLGVATEKLRVWDSNADQFFWIIVIGCVFYINGSFIRQHYFPVVIILILETSAYLISYLKFRRTIATHSYMAKFWTLTMLAFLIDLTLHSQSTITFKICVLFGIISRIEIILIIWRLKSWATDVPSLLAVRKINKR